jgi:hypothetical protein
VREGKLNSLPDIIRNLLPLVGVRLPLGFGVGHGETIRKEAMNDMTVSVEVVDHVVMELIDRAEDVVVTNVEPVTLYAPYDQRRGLVWIPNDATCETHDTLVRRHPADFMRG